MDDFENDSEISKEVNLRVKEVIIGLFSLFSE